MKKISLSPSITLVIKWLGIFVLFTIIFYWAVSYESELVKNQMQDVKDKKQIDSLTIEKIKLEIELKKRELAKNTTRNHYLIIR